MGYCAVGWARTTRAGGAPRAKTHGALMSCCKLAACFVHEEDMSPPRGAVKRNITLENKG